ncbi:MAG: biopolymer transporter ExbD [Flavobacteriales bacterium CG03_land_8_20_14_0_80_35_15]|nr:biopolymer transporter ExbD [Zetaproteobacteria bacterium]OIO11054.1 MAG: biopolymer transporter ExbD [Flavobacteriaceae bacterium CG1_02_35_72]PIR14027.1 MAG: biopolymer transporter ExbD [Flavobacteriales bacterium CG11_big_fil_rev_8_21_14_0_20_35_7]PIV18416.1 MAG: biopolymer transporter ExbD [Flavobacteriales bacterium CG03_land_8_20_14_0_80_35_15]PJA05950.1 MAG: biopolymer transporter ExbD [Flavobacteriales bacterium CG_4_10_14_0_2_um_filter_35_18]
MNFRGRNKVNAQFNMSSMTDIVFLLLIFFMITSTLVTTSALDILLPKADGKTINKKNTSISITKNLEYFLNDNPTSITEDLVETELKVAMANLENPVLTVRAEEGVPIEKVVLVMDIANRNKYKVILAVRSK